MCEQLWQPQFYYNEVSRIKTCCIHRIRQGYSESDDHRKPYKMKCEPKRGCELLELKARGTYKLFIVVNSRIIRMSRESTRIGV